MATSTAENPGDYELTIAGVKNDATSDDLAFNYDIDNVKNTSYIPATLTITKKALKLAANDASKKVGEKDPTFTLATTTGITGDEITGVTFTREKEGTAEGEEVGKYAITPVYSAAKVIRDKGKTTEKDVTDYYTFALADSKNQGKLEIRQGGIVVTIKDAEKFYGEEDPEFTYTVTGLQAGDVLKGFDASKITRTKGDDAGTYSLTATIENPNPEKYESLTVSEGIFTIKKAQLKATLPAQNVKIADATTNPQNADALTKDGITATGINNTDKIADLIEVGYAYSYDAFSGKDETKDDGYIALLIAKEQKNYEFVEVNGVKLKTPSTAAFGKLIIGKGGNTKKTITLKRAAKEDVDDTEIDGKNDAAALIAKYAGEEVKVNIGTYEMLPEKWYPLVLPCEVTVAEISSKFNYAVVNVLNTANTDPKKISFKLHMGTIPANTPFVVKAYGEKAKDYKVDMNGGDPFTARTIVAPSDYAAVTTADAVDASGVKFIGIYTGKTDGFRSNQYYFSASAEYNKYYQGNATNTTYLRPLGAYLEVPSNEAAARIIEFEEADGTITAIQVARTDNGAANNAEGWYTIGGVKLQGAPTQKGVYIQNGKKVIVK